MPHQHKFPAAVQRQKPAGCLTSFAHGLSGGVADAIAHFMKLMNINANNTIVGWNVAANPTERQIGAIL